jgi:hypothetical protein
MHQDKCDQADVCPYQLATSMSCLSRSEAFLTRIPARAPARRGATGRERNRVFLREVMEPGDMGMIVEDLKGVDEPAHGRAVCICLITPFSTARILPHGRGAGEDSSA